MGATELFCPECDAYVATLFPGFMRHEYECPNCFADLAFNQLVDRKRGSLALAGGGAAFPITATDVGTFNGGTTGLISGVTVPQGATLVVYTVEGLATGVGVLWADVVWNGTALTKVANHGDGGVTRTNVHMLSNASAGRGDITITPTDPDVDSIVAFATVISGVLASSTELDVFDKTSETLGTGTIINNALLSATTAEIEIMLAWAVSFITSTAQGTWATNVTPTRSVLNTTGANNYRVSEGKRNLIGKAVYSCRHTLPVSTEWLGQGATFVR